MRRHDSFARLSRFPAEAVEGSTRLTFDAAVAQLAAADRWTKPDRD
jgi:hypothetical protein